MKLKYAQNQIETLVDKPLGTFLKAEQLKDIKKAKGRSGQLLETTIGLNLSNTALDFEDGELKTNKCNEVGKPMETMFITQISGLIDSLLSHENFYESKLYKKINNLLYVPICKIGDPTDWRFLQPIHVNLNSPEFLEIKLQIEKDYYDICSQLNAHITSSPDGFIHTSSGKYIQIRSKDSKPYHPIYSKQTQRNISNKNHAFYFKKDFMLDIAKINALILA